MTLDEVADRLRITPATLRWLRHQGTGPEGFKIGRRVVFTTSAVEAFIAQQRAAAK
jgi:predicted DNA-binding transcriptional regulator AlpA